MIYRSTRWGRRAQAPSRQLQARHRGHWYRAGAIPLPQGRARASPRGITEWPDAGEALAVAALHCTPLARTALAGREYW